MKLLVISTSILLIACFGLVAISAETGAKAQPATPVKADANSTKDVNSAADVNTIAQDSNEAQATDKELEQFKKELSRIEKGSKRQDYDWMRQRIENRIKLLESSHEQCVAELNLIRGIAVEEGATKTVKAIDLLIEKKTERFEELIQAIKEKETRDEAREEREREKEREKGKTRRLPEHRRK